MYSIFAWVVRQNWLGTPTLGVALMLQAAGTNFEKFKVPLINRHFGLKLGPHFIHAWMLFAIVFSIANAATILLEPHWLNIVDERVETTMNSQPSKRRLYILVKFMWPIYVQTFSDVLQYICFVLWCQCHAIVSISDPCASYRNSFLYACCFANTNGFRHGIAVCITFVHTNWQLLTYCC